MEEEGDNKAKLIVGGAIVVIFLVVGIFIVRGFMAKKDTVQPAKLPTFKTTISPTTHQTQSLTPTPTIAGGTTGTNSYYYYQSQGNSHTQSTGTQSQSQNGTNQTQSQTLPNGMIQTQSQ